MRVLGIELWGLLKLQPMYLTVPVLQAPLVGFEIGASSSLVDFKHIL